MTRVYPKHPKDIVIRIIDRSVEDGILSRIATTAEVRLSDKLDDYLNRLGYSGSHLTGIIVLLLTQGKVQVDFGGQNERLELVNVNDRLESAQAMNLLDDYINESMKATGTMREGKAKTQQIVVQTRRSARG